MNERSSVRVLLEGMTRNRGGIETFIMGIVRTMQPLGFECDVLVPVEGCAYADEMRELGVRTIPIVREDEGSAQFRRAMRTVLRENSYDIFWSNRPNLARVASMRIAQEENVPLVVAHAHSSFNYWGRRDYLRHVWNRLSIDKLADVKFACSRGAVDWFYRGTHGACIVPNAIDVGDYGYSSESRARVRSEFGIGNELVLGHVGRLSAVKNQAYLLEVLHTLVTRGRKAKLLLCGDGEDRPLLEKRAKELGIAGDVIFAGNRQDVPAVLSAMDVFAFPSVGEGLPFALVEAQASGLPCLVSDAVSDEVRLSDNVRFLDLGDPLDRWADAAVTLATAGTDRKLAAQRLTDRGFDIHQRAQWLAHYLRNSLEGVAYE